MADFSHQPSFDVTRLVQELDRSFNEFRRYSVRWREYGPFKVDFGGTTGQSNHASVEIRCPGARIGRAAMAVLERDALSSGERLLATVVDKDVVRLSKFAAPGTFSANQTFLGSFKLVTTDAGNVDVPVLALTIDQQSAYFRFNTVGMRDTGDNYISRAVELSIRRTAGTVSQNQLSSVTHNTGTGSTATISYGVSGDNTFIRIAGNASETWNWSTDITLHVANPASAVAAIANDIQYVRVLVEQ